MASRKIFQRKSLGPPLTAPKFLKRKNKTLTEYTATTVVTKPYATAVGMTELLNVLDIWIEGLRLVLSRTRPN
jgi:hypothetical protein